MCFIKNRKKKMKEKLRSEYSRLLRPTDFPTMVESHKIVADIGFAILKEHGKHGTKTSWDHDGNLLYQMTMLKSLSLTQHATPLNHLNSIDGSRLNDTFDPFAMASIVRSQYEAFCNFNNIYIQSKSIDELKLKYHLWVISGLNYRQRFKATTPAHVKKKEGEQKEIANLLETIKANACFIQLDEQSQKNVFDGIKKKDWQFKIDGVKASKIAWHEMMTNAGASDMLEGQYSSLSLNSHPSNVSVFQFGTMYIEGMQVFNTRMAIQLSKVFTAMFIRDYLVYFKEYQKYFETFAPIPQMLINTYNGMFRNEGYRLNDINNMLN